MEIFDISPAVCPSEALTRICPAGPQFLLRLDPDAELLPDALEQMSAALSSSAGAYAYGSYLLAAEDGGEPIHVPVSERGHQHRDDADLGPVVMVDTAVWNRVIGDLGDYRYAGWYDMRLRLLSACDGRFSCLGCLSTKPLRRKTEKPGSESQFDYVAAEAAVKQREMERVYIDYLKRSGAYLSHEPMRVDVGQGEFAVEASVVIPVRNRVSTVADAVDSALSQQLDKPFNVIVVDNDSTDGTNELLRQRYGDNPRVVLLGSVRYRPRPEVPQIGDCWNAALHSAACGRFAIQLDSDDVYSAPDTLQKIVDTFYRERCAMLAGAYCLTDFSLRPLPPGVIDHREWTELDGRNNLLRVNGIGAPRAFYTPIARLAGFPNVSYGEDYCMALHISRLYHVGRIYDVLYNCRRWEGNSDHGLDPERIAINNIKKDAMREREFATRCHLDLELLTARQLEAWPEARGRYEALTGLVEERLDVAAPGREKKSFRILHNPARAISTAAPLDAASIAARPCFLCAKNRPAEQITTPILDGRYHLLINPFPIFPRHFVIAAADHTPQTMSPERLADMAKIASDVLPSDYVVVYNGAGAGASAPDHFHFQAVRADELADGADVVSAPFSIAFSPEKTTARQLLEAIGDTPTNIMIGRNAAGKLYGRFWLRPCHRPACYGTDGYIISPASIDLMGAIITPRRADFDRLTADTLRDILTEVTTVPKYAPAIPINVGIVAGNSLTLGVDGAFVLNDAYLAPQGRCTATIEDGAIRLCSNDVEIFRGTSLSFIPVHPAVDRFEIGDVTIGVDFHWERRETQRFEGALRLEIINGKIQAINTIDIERYLVSVITSEMNATSPIELLRAHAIISRSWLLAQLERKNLERKPQPESADPDNIVTWRDREDHDHFDVCADDHCQRYQGVTRIESAAEEGCQSLLEKVEDAVNSTAGIVLMDEDGHVADARFSKCCGGVTELFESCWGDEPHSYLAVVRDDVGGAVPDLTDEPTARRWIESRPDAFCNDTDGRALRAVLNSYDREVPDLYRWTETYTPAYLDELIKRRSGIDFGHILSLEPIERGSSGRIVRLRITGTKRTAVVGKELTIRRWLSESHLRSSAFVVDRLADGTWQLRGAGWGHGVGLCQVGAATMALRGYPHPAILSHYYPTTRLLPFPHPHP